MAIEFIQMNDLGDQIEKIQKQLTGELAERGPDVLMDALLAAGRSIRKRVVKEANERYDYNKYGKKLPATNKTLKINIGKGRNEKYFRMISKGPMSELADFMVTPNVKSGKRPTAYSARVLKGGATDAFTKSPKPFLVYVKAGNKGARHLIFAYRAKGKKRLPLEKVLAPSVPSMLKNAGLYEISQEQMKSVIDHEVDKSINRMLKKAAKAAQGST